MTFNKSFKFSLYDQVYHAYVEGVIEYDEVDNDIIYSVIDTMVIEDLDGNLIDESHDDYEEIVTLVESRDYQPDFNW